MKPFSGAVLLGGLAVLLVAESSADAAWNNVFQVSCFRQRRTAAASPACCAPTPVVAAAAPANCCPQPCQPQCTTSYVQRCYYQPVTTYKQQCVVEPVTTMQTSYYYEPVCSYRYSCYYDPCTCSYQQVATPVTSYRLRSRCNAVTSYLQRTQLVPVTSYQLSYYYEPVTTCCSTTTGAPVTKVPSGATITPAPASPGVGESTTPLPGTKPRVGEESLPSDSFRPNFGETQQPPMNGADGSSYRQPRLRTPEPTPPSEPVAPKVRLDRIVQLPSPNVEGRVVRTDGRSPQSGVRLLFVNSDQDDQQQTVTADGQGRFEATLAKGNWLVYVRNREGTPVFQKRIVVKDQERVPVLLTSR